MAERQIEDGFIDCPRFGIIGELRCSKSCESYGDKDEDCVTCYFGEERPAITTEEDEEDEAQPAAEEA